MSAGEEDKPEMSEKPDITVNKAGKEKTKEESNDSRKYSKAKLIEILKEEADKLGRTPPERHFTNKEGLPSPFPYTTAFGSWNEAVEAAGLEPNEPYRGGGPRKYSNEQLISLLKKEAEKLERTPPCSHFQNTKSLPSPTCYQQRWGSWNEALKAAGLEPNMELKIVEKRAVEGEEVTVSRRAEELGIDQEKEEKAKELLNSIGSHRGHSRKDVVDACIYLASQLCNRPIGLAYVFGDREWSAIKFVKDTLDVHPNPTATDYLPWVQKTVNDHMEEKIGVRPVTDEIVKEARILLEGADLAGRNPVVQVAGGIYLASKESDEDHYLTQGEVAEALNVAELSVRNAYQKLKEYQLNK